MGQIVILTKGLPASGKSTWTKEQITKPGNKFKAVNKDALREMIDGGVWSQKNEKFILKVRDMLIREALKDGFDVIVDDTNLHPKHERQVGEIAKRHNATLVVQSFTDVDVETCIKRDLKRPNSVGERVIRSMWKKFLFTPPPAPAAPEDIPGAPDAIIVDVDGTIAQMVDRGPYDYSKVSTDRPKCDVIDMVESWSNSGACDPVIIFCSGRPELCREDTEEWIRKHVTMFCDWTLFMRPTYLETDPSKRDFRPDYVVKQEIYSRKIRGKYNVNAVFDDRAQVVAMWRANGLLTLAVAEGGF